MLLPKSNATIMKKTIILIFLNLYSFLIFSQDYKGHIKEYSSNNNIQFVNIINKTKNVYTFSDDNGNFLIPAKIGDTLIFSHINYNNKEINLTQFNDSSLILLEPKIYNLEEIIINPRNKSINYKIGFKKGKNYHRKGIALNTYYALKIKNSKKINILKIEIPILFEDNLKYNNQGGFELQVYTTRQNDLNNNLSPISKRYFVNINEGMKNLSFEMDNPTIIPKEDFYIIFNRVIPGDIFNKKSIYSVNPSLYFRNEGQKGDLVVKNIFSEEWIDFQDYYKNYRATHVPSPLFCFELTVEEIE